MHDVSHVNQAQTDAPADGRSHVRIHDLELRTVDRALIGLDRTFKLTNLRPLGIQLLFGDNPLFVEQLVAFVVDLHVAELCLILGELPFGLLELDLIGTRVDIKEVVTLMHELPFLEIDLSDLSVYTAVYRHGIKRRNCPKAVEIDGKISTLRGGNDHGHYEAARARSLAALALTRSARSRGPLRLGAGARSTEVPIAKPD